MRLLILTLALLGLAATQTADPTMHQLKLEPAVKVYVLSPSIADDVKVCTAIVKDQRLACVYVWQMKAMYEHGKGQIPK
jgi:hypothetical protein